jgi:hypothetical protein
MVHGLLVTIFGAMSFNFAVKALVAFHKFCFLFFGMVGSVDSIDVHVVSSLRGSTFLVFDFKCFVESAVVVFVEGILFLPFAMQPNYFFSPTIEGPGGSEWVVGISVYNASRSPFFSPFLKRAMVPMSLSGTLASLATLLKSEM